MYPKMRGPTVGGCVHLVLPTEARAQTAVLRQDQQNYVVDVAIAGKLEGTASPITVTLFTGDQGQEDDRDGERDGSPDRWRQAIAAAATAHGSTSIIRMR
ncbi:MAG: hypothetical protein R2708_23470 [Vicinamibacterales bacterium]